VWGEEQRWVREKARGGYWAHDCARQNEKGRRGGKAKAVVSARNGQSNNKTFGGHTLDGNS